MRILFIVAYPNQAASSRTRVYDYFPALVKHNIVCYPICFTPNWFYNLPKEASIIKKYIYHILFRVGRVIKICQALGMSHFYDIVFVQKITFPFGLEKLLKFFNNNIIFDFDDAIFTNDLLRKDFLAERAKKKFESMLKASKCCIVENNYNGKVALRFCPWVEKIIGPIDDKKYFIKNKNIQENIIIGWTGSSSTSKYLYFIEEALKEIFNKYNNLVLRVVGAESDFKIDSIDCQILQWSLEKEVSYVQSFDIGLMPLPDDEWTRGKGGYKILQYMAAGVPTIASPVEVNKEIIKDGANGFLAGSKEEWVEKLSFLIESSDLRKRMGLRGRKTIEERYSLIAASDKLLQIFNRIING